MGFGTIIAKICSNMTASTEQSNESITSKEFMPLSGLFQAARDLVSSEAKSSQVHLQIGSLNSRLAPEAADACPTEPMLPTVRTVRPTDLDRPK